MWKRGLESPGRRDGACREAHSRSEARRVATEHELVELVCIARVHMRGGVAERWACAPELTTVLDGRWYDGAVLGAAKEALGLQLP